MQVMLFALGLAFGQDLTYADHLQAAREAILKAEWDAARAALNTAEASAAASPALISNSDLVRLWFFRGVIEWKSGDVNGQALDLWRSALVLGTDYTPDADVLPEVDAQDVFYALREEQKGKDQVALGLPEDPGDATIFVDGKRYEPLDAIYYGTHFVQIRCPEGNLAGSWHTFGTPPPDYLVLCSGGSYPVAGGKTKTKAPKAPKAEKPPKEPKPVAEEKPPKEAKSSGSKSGGGDTAGWVLMGVGGAMVLGGTATNFLMVNPAWNEAEAANADPASVTADEAEAIISTFNTGRYLTIGLVGLGVVTAGTGVVVGPLLDGAVMIGPGMVRFRW